MHAGELTKNLHFVRHGMSDNSLCAFNESLAVSICSQTANAALQPFVISHTLFLSSASLLQAVFWLLPPCINRAWIALNTSLWFHRHARFLLTNWLQVLPHRSIQRLPLWPAVFMQVGKPATNRRLNNRRNIQTCSNQRRTGE